MNPTPCPFCASTNVSVEWEWCSPLTVGDTTRRWFVECANCSCQGPFAQTEPKAIPLWNNRPLFIITYEVSTAGGHGDPGYTEIAIWLDAGAFGSEAQALAWIQSQKPHYGISNPKVTPLTFR